MWCFSVRNVAVRSFTPPPTLDKTKPNFCKEIFVDARYHIQLWVWIQLGNQDIFCQWIRMKCVSVGCCHKGLEYWNKAFAIVACRGVRHQILRKTVGAFFMPKGMTLNWQTPRRQVTTVLVRLSASTGTCQNRQARSSMENIVAHPSDWIASGLLTGLNLMGCVTALFLVVNYETMRNICFQHCLGRSSPSWKLHRATLCELLHFSISSSTSACLITLFQ